MLERVKGTALLVDPSLLQRLRTSPQGAAVNWEAVEAMLPYGGIRIEDDVVCTEDAPLNLTREAFAEAA